MAGLGSAQRSGGQHANHDHARALLLAALEQPAEVLCGKARRQRVARARVQEVVADLGRASPPRSDHLVHRRGITEGRDAVEADLAVLDEPGHRREDDVAHVLGGERLARPLGGDAVVQLEQVDALSAQAAKTLFQAAGDGSSERGHGDIGNAHLRADENRRLQRAKRAAQVLLRLAVPVAGRGVEVVDAQLHGAGDSPLALGRRAADQQPADVAAAEPERGHPKPGSSQ